MHGWYQPRYNKGRNRHIVDLTYSSSESHWTILFQCEPWSVVRLSLFSRKLCYNTDYYISSPNRRIGIPSPINGHDFKTAHLIRILTFDFTYLEKQDRIIDEIY